LGGWFGAPQSTVGAAAGPETAGFTAVVGTFVLVVVFGTFVLAVAVLPHAAIPAASAIRAIDVLVRVIQISRCLGFNFYSTIGVVCHAVIAVPVEGKTALVGKVPSLVIEHDPAFAVAAA
jgi:hypothetical protein